MTAGMALLAAGDRFAAWGGGQEGRLSLPLLCAALEGLEVPFRVVGGPPADGLKFCSLRAPEPNGIYFSESGAAPPVSLAGSVVLARVPISSPAATTIVVKHPQVVFYQLMNHFSRHTGDVGAGIHPTAVIHPEASIDETSYVGPFCVVGRARIGAGVRLHSHVVVFDGSEIGDEVVIEPHSVIGATGVAWVWNPETGARIVQPQTGGVRIGRGCFLGSDVTLVRGSVNEDTVLGDHCVVAHGTKIGHGCRIGAEVHFANNVSIAGNVDIGDRSFLGSGCVVRPMTRIATGTVVGAGAVVVKHVTEPGKVLSGVPAVEMKDKASHAGVPKPLQSGAA